MIFRFFNSVKYRVLHLLALSIAVAYLSTAAVGQIQPQDGPSCRTYASCDELGTEALRRGGVDDAISLFEQQAGFAELADIEGQTKSRGAPVQSPCRLELTAYNNLAVAYSKKQDYLQARAWALVALSCDKQSHAAQFNLRNIERELVGWQWPETPAGEYVQYAGRGMWQTFIVEPSEPDKIHFCFSGLWWGLGEGPSGLGDLEGIVPFHDKQAEYASHEFGKCLLSMHFDADKLEVTQVGSDSDCGFGHNVTANGTFQRISKSAKCEQEPK